MEIYIIRYLINELLKSKTYTLTGIAHYTNISIEIIEKIFFGFNVGNIITLPRRLVELHRFEQPDFYHKLFEKLMRYKNEYDFESHNRKIQQDIYNLY